MKQLHADFQGIEVSLALILYVAEILLIMECRRFLNFILQ